MAETKTGRKPKTEERMSAMWLDVLYFIIGTIAIGTLAGLLGGKMGIWKTLDLPTMSPPSWLFPVAWAVAYTAIGVAMYLAWRNKERKSQNRMIDLMWFYITITLFSLWPLFFFRLEIFIIATVLMGLAAISSIITMIRFWYNNIISGVLYSIFSAWTIYAFYLSLAVALLN